MFIMVKKLLSFNAEPQSPQRKAIEFTLYVSIKLRGSAPLR